MIPVQWYSDVRSLAVRVLQQKAHIKHDRQHLVCMADIGTLDWQVNDSFSALRRIVYYRIKFKPQGAFALATGDHVWLSGSVGGDMSRQ